MRWDLVARRTRGEVEAAIREATLAELAERGYAGVTFEGVARRAGTSKPVLYRRHPDRAHLVAAAVGGGLVRDSAALLLPGTSLREDVLTILRASVSRVRELGVASFRGLLGEADAEVLAELDRLSADAATTLVVRAVEAGQRRGELGPSSPDVAVLRLPAVLVRERLLFGGLDEDGLVHLVDVVVLPLLRLSCGPAPRG